MNNSLSYFAMHPLLEHLLKNHVLSQKKALLINEKRPEPHFHLTLLILREKWMTQPEILSVLLNAIPIHRVHATELHLEYCVTLLPMHFIQLFRIIPVKKIDHTLHLAVTDPLNEWGMQCLRFHTQCNIIPHLISDHEFDALFTEHQPKKQAWNDWINHHTTEPITAHTISNDETLDTPLMECLHELITDCHQQGATDIHVDPMTDHYRIRFRAQGNLMQLASVPVHLGKRLISGLKILSQVDITEKRLPQDGRFQLESMPNSHIRSAFCPSFFGEKCALRVLQQRHMNSSLEELGLPNQHIPFLMQALQHTEGLILATGATGSGKTTTLYALLNLLNANQKHICTIEHPVEYILEGATQLNVQPHLGFDFSNGLRALLRHDPDVILIGEIRDQETALTALQAAETGHLVLASLHASNPFSAYFRLKHLIHDPHVSLMSLSFVIGQRVLDHPHLHSREFELLQLTPEVHHAFHSTDSETVLRHLVTQSNQVLFQSSSG